METITTDNRLINILFVDNDSVLVEDMKDYLKKSEIEKRYGLNFVFASDVKSALRKMAELNINLVVLEIVLPIVSGYHLINAIKQTHKELPIIIYTRIKNPQDLAKMASAQVNNIFLKELMKKEDLIEIIQKKETNANIDATVMELSSQIRALHEGERQHDLKLIQCPACHLILAPEAHFCNNCGQKIYHKTKTLLAQSAETNKIAGPDETKKDVKKKK